MRGNEALNSMFDTILNVRELDDTSIQKAKQIFDKYKAENKIMNCNFEDSKWNLTDEYSNVGLNFTIQEIAYRKYYYPIYHILSHEFILYVKSYVMMLMGSLVLKSIRTFIYDLHRLLKNDPHELATTNEEIFIQHPSLVNEFISMLPPPINKDDENIIMLVMEKLSDYRYSFNQINKQRHLADFSSYFLFNDILEEYWASPITEDERLFYYPLYLWWRITAVIPLRPCEFIVTDRECLNKRDDGYYLTLRRNNLKGKNKQVHYNIANDYYTVSYKIPDKLANEIQKYIDLTKQYNPTDIFSLFVPDTHYKKWNQKRHRNSRFLTYINMNCIMRYFYRDVIVNRYGLKVCYERQNTPLQDGYIAYMHLGDTRHIALINIIAEGGTPVLAMLLAGHDNMEMASHYYSNIASLIECRTYRQYKKMLKGDVQYAISFNNHPPMNIKDSVSLEDHGQCFSQKFSNGDFSDCINISGPNGEIGYCPNCPYYRKSDESIKFFDGNDIYIRKIQDGYNHLKEVIKNVRLYKDNKDDLKEAILQLQNSGYEYEQYLKEKLRNGENNA